MGAYGLTCGDAIDPSSEVSNMERQLTTTTTLHALICTMIGTVAMKSL